MIFSTWSPGLKAQGIASHAMPVATDVSAQLYSIAWGGLLVILAFYVGGGVALRWRPQRTVVVARYEPPRGLSPAIAALLVENGRCERSFAVALISLATKGYVKILQKGDWFTIENLRDTDAQLPLEESTVLLALFDGDGRDASPPAYGPHRIAKNAHRAAVLALPHSNAPSH